MGKMGNTWRRVETITKTGATDQGVTLTAWCIEAVCTENRGLCCINVKHSFFCPFQLLSHWKHILWILVYCFWHQWPFCIYMLIVSLTNGCICHFNEPTIKLIHEDDQYLENHHVPHSSSSPWVSCVWWVEPGFFLNKWPDQEKLCSWSGHVIKDNSWPYLWVINSPLT